MSEFTETQLAEAIRSANDRVRPITRQEIERRTVSVQDWDDVDVLIDLSVEPERALEQPVERTGNRPVLAVAAGLVLIVAGAIALLRLRTDEGIEATDPTPATSVDDSTPTDPATPAEPDNHMVAVEFARALEALDLEAAKGLLADDPGVIQLSMASADAPIEVDFLGWEILGARAQLEGCRPDYEFATIFTCSLLVDDTASRAQDIEPLDLQTTIVVHDGFVSSARLSGSAYGEWIARVWTPWIEWMAVERADEFTILYPNGPPELSDIMDPEIRRLFKQMAQEYVDDVAGQGASDTGS